MEMVVQLQIFLQMEVLLHIEVLLQMEVLLHMEVPSQVEKVPSTKPRQALHQLAMSNATFAATLCRRSTSKTIFNALIRMRRPLTPAKRSITRAISLDANSAAHSCTPITCPVISCASTSPSSRQVVRLAFSGRNTRTNR